MTNDYYNTTYKATTNIDKLIKDGKLRLAYVVVMDELTKYPEDTYLNYQLFLINIINKDYESAALLFDKLDEEKACNMIIIVCIKLGMKEKLSELYNKYYSELNMDKIGDRKYRMIYIYLNKLFNKNFILPDFLLRSYVEMQMYDYSEKSAINNVYGNHCNQNVKNKGIFKEDINIKEMFDFASKHIKNGMDSKLSNFGEVYDFYYSDCGKLEDGKIANGFSVVTFVGSTDIIAMFPNYFTTPWKLIEYREDMVHKNKDKHLKIKIKK